MLRKPVVFCLIALAFFLVLPSLAMAENPASPVAAAGQLGTAVSDVKGGPVCGNLGAAQASVAESVAPDFLLDPALEPEELPADVEKPFLAGCLPIIYRCVKCTINTRKECQYWSCSGTLIGCGPCRTAC